MPDLYIIAGPNGAGKSTYSSLLVPLYLNVFDADKLLAEKEKLFPDIESSQLMEGITDHDFERDTARAIGTKSDFAYETNFSGDGPLQTPDRFRQAGYRINLIYIGLESVNAAIARVEYRKSLGGHNVENEEIISRYHKGLENLETHVPYFDRTLIYAGQKGTKIATPRIVYQLQKGLILERHLPIPRWARSLPVEELPLTKQIQQHPKKGRRR